MKLSEAIRLGAMLDPQVRGAFFTAEGTCALGAAAAALHGDAESLIQAFPVLSTSSTCPACDRFWFRDSVSGLIMHLNDYHGWSRTRIADWVLSLEEKENNVEGAPASGDSEDDQAAVCAAV